LQLAPLELGLRVITFIKGGGSGSGEECEKIDEKEKRCEVRSQNGQSSKIFVHKKAKKKFN
jgi:hypothetical protein